jgi:lipopolysaccharide biosynthesis glycosyltransferase
MRCDPLPVVIGIDRREWPAYHVLCHSIVSRASGPVAIYPLYLPALEAHGKMWRERHPKQSTEFSFSRFLAPQLVGYRGKCIFMDCDMLCLGDVYELASYCGIGHDVAVVKHDYRPKNTTKFLGHVQTTYEKKLWSAVMVFNAYTGACQELSDHYVNTAQGIALHQFHWVNEARIGELPEAWQFVPNHSEPRVSQSDIRLIHWTEGGPWFKEYEKAPFANLWFKEAAQAFCVSRETVNDNNSQTSEHYEQIK